MKLAEALILRADTQKRIEQLKQRLNANARVQQGEKPAEDPKKLMTELDALLRQLEALMKNINRTNSATEVQKSVTMSDALAMRDVLMMKRNAYAGLAQAASVRQDRVSRSEVKFVSTVEVAKLQKSVDDLSKQYRELDAKIQALNWLTELLT
jgi:hypothetical protein